MKEVRDAYDTVRNLRPLPRAVTALNHPDLAGRKAMPHTEDNDANQDEGRVREEACMKLLLDRFPHVQALALKRCEQPDSFRELCEEYWACTQVLERLERPGAEESLRSEYGALRLRLPGEHSRHITDQRPRPTARAPTATCSARARRRARAPVPTIPEATEPIMQTSAKRPLREVLIVDSGLS